jgi:hypothetical protein
MAPRAARFLYYLMIRFFFKYHPEVSQQAAECHDLAASNIQQKRSIRTIAISNSDIQKKMVESEL